MLILHLSYQQASNLHGWLKVIGMPINFSFFRKAIQRIILDSIGLKQISSLISIFSIKAKSKSSKPTQRQASVDGSSKASQTKMRSSTVASSSLHTLVSMSIFHSPLSSQAQLSFSTDSIAAATKDGGLFVSNNPTIT
jgi:hypothetical protein